MSLNGIRISCVSCARSISLEPVIFLYIVGVFLDRGAEVKTQLMLWKICRFEFGYNDTVCEDLDSEANDDLQSEVQTRANDLLLVSQWIGGVPVILYSLFVGALSDDFGRKPFVFFPILGMLLVSVCDIINWALVETLPLEFFYTDQIANYFGGQAVYYLGYYRKVNS